MNVHLLRHIPECVQNWGPLWAYSCFTFESLNGALKRHFHGTKNMNKQVQLNVYLSSFLSSIVVCVLVFVLLGKGRREVGCGLLVK